MNGEIKDPGDFINRKKSPEEDLKILDIRKVELENENVDCNLLIEWVFDFAKNATEVSKNRDIETKKVLFRFLGSNLTLKDKKLCANLND